MQNQILAQFELFLNSIVISNLFTEQVKGTFSSLSERVQHYTDVRSLINNDGTIERDRITALHPNIEDLEIKLNTVAQKVLDKLKADLNIEPLFVKKA